MTEEEARAWLAASGVPRETIERLDAYVALLLADGTEQNLISPSTFAQVWSRHIVDSAQLLAHAPTGGSTLDVGSGAGFPGLIFAALRDSPITLVEPRTRRAAFLVKAAQILGVEDRVRVLGCRVEMVPTSAIFELITARAYAPLPQLLQSVHHLARAETVWVLPKGKSANAEVDAARASWHGSFRTVPSITDPEAAIIVASGVRPRKRR